MEAPLAGLLVADLTQNVAGPFSTQILGDMGADVVKVERPGRGDDARAWAPPYWGEESDARAIKELADRHVIEL
jgi:crotonobetainyl-CoA:carnitine CoA-transferase CaiB-like acyl-CoA transferase